MSVNENNRGFLKEKLGGYSVDPPESVWSNITSRLSGGGRRTLLILSLSAAAAIALAVTLGIHYFGPDVRGSRTLSETTGAGPADELNEAGNRPPVTPDEADARQKESARGEEEAQQEESARDEEHARQEGMPRPDERPGRLEERVAAILEETEGSPSRETGGTPEEVKTQRMAVHPENDSVQSPEIQSESSETLTENKEVTEVEPSPIDSLTDRELVTEDEGTLEPMEWAEEKKEGRGRWIVGAALSPLYSFRDASSGDLPDGSEFESGMIAYAGGVQVSYRAVGRLAIETGVFFNKMGVSIGASGIRTYNTAPDFSPLDGATERASWQVVSNSVGNIVSNTGDIYVNDYKLNAATESSDFMGNAVNETYTAEEGIRQHLDYLELPFNLRYTVVDRDFELQLVGGISTNFLINNYVTAVTAEGPEEIGYLTNIRSINYAGNAGLGMVYHFHSRISLRLEPRFRYFLNSVNDATLPSTRPYSLGLYTGLNFTF